MERAHTGRKETLAFPDPVLGPGQERPSIRPRRAASTADYPFPRNGPTPTNAGCSKNGIRNPWMAEDRYSWRRVVPVRV